MPSPEVQDRLIAEAEEHRANAVKVLAEAEKLTAEAATAKALARKSEIEAAKAEEAERERQAMNKFQHLYVFDDAVGSAAVDSCISALQIWSRTCPGCEITIRFCSPGGDVISGMYLFDYLMHLRKKGHRVITEAWGMAASMAGILLQAGDVRRIGAEAYVLIHEITFGVRGKVGEVEDEMEFIRKVSDRVLNIFAARAAEAAANGTAAEPLSKKQFANRWARKDWWLSSEECLKYGVVDEVI